MREYHKIHTVWSRDPGTNHKTLIEDHWALPEFEYLAECRWRATEKIDGTNIRIGWDGTNREFGGRTDEAQIPTFLLKKLEERFPAEVLASAFPEQGAPIVLYGEGYGNRIQKVGASYIPDGVDFVLFDVLVGETWLEWENSNAVAAALGVPHVPEISVGTLRDAIEFVRGRPASLMAAVPVTMEGLVMRPIVELKTRRGHRVITKVKCKDFRP